MKIEKSYDENIKIIEISKEFIVAVDEICEAYENQIKSITNHYENELTTLRKYIDVLERSPDTKKYQISTYRFKRQLTSRVNDIKIFIVKNFINSIRVVSKKLGLLSLLKKTKVFKKIYKKGIVDKYRD